MRRTLLLAALAVLLVPVSARAAITEYEIEPGAPADKHVPLYLKAGVGGILYYADAGTTFALGRMSPAGERLPAVTLASEPWTVLPRADGSANVSLDGGVVQVTGDGRVLTTYSPNPAWGLALTSAGVLYGTTATPTGWQICAAACPATPHPANARPLDLLTAADDSVWATLYEADLLVRTAPGSTAIALTVALPAGSGPDQLALGPDGDVWATMYDADAVDRITADGSRMRFALPAGTGPDGITAGPDGSLWVAGSTRNVILRLSTAGAVTGTWAIPTPDSTPVGIAATPDGAIWFTESSSGKLGRLVPDPVNAVAPVGPGRRGGTVAHDTVKPRFLRSPSFSPSSVRLGRAATLRVALSEAARLKVIVGKATRGRRVNGACVKTSRKNRSRSTCTRYPTVRTLTKTGVAGANSLTLSTRGLHTGTYRATVTATDSAGNKTTPARTALTITRSH